MHLRKLLLEDLEMYLLWQALNTHSVKKYDNFYWMSRKIPVLRWIHITICVFLYLIYFEQYNLQTADQTYQQLQLQKKGAGNVYRLVLSSWKVNIAENLHCKYL